jgi:hypothetical protein
MTRLRLASCLGRARRRWWCMTSPSVSTPVCAPPWAHLGGLVLRLSTSVTLGYTPSRQRGGARTAWGCARRPRRWWPASPRVPGRAPTVRHRRGLTRDSIPCPSAADPARNRHRSGVAWSKSAIRAILTNPRYGTGRQVWNRQRKAGGAARRRRCHAGARDPDVLGTPARRGCSPSIWCTRPSSARTPFTQAQQLLAERGRGPTRHSPHRVRRPYQLRGVIFRG